ncbi:MAG: hypothetical protein ACREEE_13090 [Dongiaceae bacterium]
MIVAPHRVGNAKTDRRQLTPPRDDIESVAVAVSGRLHLGFVDLHGGLGRRYGSVGVALEAPATRLSARRGQGIAACGSSSALSGRLRELPHFDAGQR